MNYIKDPLNWADLLAGCALPFRFVTLVTTSEVWTWERTWGCGVSEDWATCGKCSVLIPAVPDCRDENGSGPLFGRVRCCKMAYSYPFLSTNHFISCCVVCNDESPIYQVFTSTQLSGRDRSGRRLASGSVRAWRWGFASFCRWFAF